MIHVNRFDIDGDGLTTCSHFQDTLVHVFRLRVPKHYYLNERHGTECHTRTAAPHEIVFGFGLDWLVLGCFTLVFCGYRRSNVLR